MLFAKQAVGVEIGRDGLKMAVLGGRREMPLLQAYRSARFQPDTIRFSHREPNILNPAAFAATVRDTWLQLLTRVNRVSLSLPDSVGRVMVLDLETRFKSREDGNDMIRWKLKKSLPVDIRDVHLDYQMLAEKETGEITVLVSLIARPVITQYEDLMLEAGLEPNRIDFTTFSLYRYFDRRLDLAENGIFISFYDGVLSLMVLVGGVPDFYRAREIQDGAGQANRIYLEISSSLLAYRDKKGGLPVAELFCFFPTEHLEALRPLVEEATGLEPAFLETDRYITRPQGTVADRNTMNRLAASLGAALRNL